VHASVERKPEARLLQRLHLLLQVQQPSPHGKAGHPFVTVSDLGEHALLARILARLPRPGAQILVGPGDDAAVIETGRNQRLVVTTDALVENVHFSRAWVRPADIGHKALAVNLSDLASMGATPRWALVSLALPDALPVADVDELTEGLAAIARAHGVSIAGGNITRSPAGLVVDVTAGGEVASRRWLTRGGGHPGDELWLSGTVGAARAGLEMLETGVRSRVTGLRDSTGIFCIDRHVRPEARVRLGIAMAKAQAARAAMDLSDGLADAVRQVATTCGCGAVVQGENVPVDAEARRWWEGRGVDALASAVAGGEDYELLFAVPPRRGGRLRNVRRQVAAPALTRIGVLTRDRGLWLEREGRKRPWPEGFEHFRG
jgi:thiamine-monophosphate kinase